MKRIVEQDDSTDEEKILPFNFLIPKKSVEKIMRAQVPEAKIAHDAIEVDLTD